MRILEPEILFIGLLAFLSDLMQECMCLPMDWYKCQFPIEMTMYVCDRLCAHGIFIENNFYSMLHSGNYIIKFHLCLSHCLKRNLLNVYIYIFLFRWVIYEIEFLNLFNQYIHFSLTFRFFCSMWKYMTWRFVLFI